MMEKNLFKSIHFMLYKQYIIINKHNNQLYKLKMSEIDFTNYAYFAE